MKLCATIGGAASVLALLLGGQARAQVVSGTFGGIVTQSFLNDGPGPGSNFNGQAIAGTFSVGPEVCVGPPIIHDCKMNVGLVFDVLGQSFDFGGMPEPNNGGQVTIDATPTGESLELFAPTPFQPYYSAELLLQGGPNAFDGFAAGGLSPDSVLPGSGGYFMDGRDVGATFAITSFDGQPVPEPGTLAVLGSALAALGWFRRRGASRP